ncbi:hypothetical protein F5B21DRAFT_112752 [Xylaria acuta]|nr:hypothetical protein F5B21DRAFT_112752 [Xylaria acuta]
MTPPWDFIEPTLAITRTPRSELLLLRQKYVDGHWAPPGYPGISTILSYTRRKAHRRRPVSIHVRLRLHPGAPLGAHPSARACRRRCAAPVRLPGADARCGCGVCILCHSRWVLMMAADNGARRTPIFHRNRGAGARTCACHRRQGRLGDRADGFGRPRTPPGRSGNVDDCLWTVAQVYSLRLDSIGRQEEDSAFSPGSRVIYHLF